MAELIKFEIIEMPELLLIGKDIRYSMDAHMKGDNRMPGFWDQCFADGTFAALEELGTFWSDAYQGVMHEWGKGDGDFTYTIGMLMKPGTAIPDGYTCYTWPAQKAAVSWIRGTDVGDVCSNAHEFTLKKIKEDGLTADKMRWCMESYACPRFTTPDENGLITLDYFIPLD